MSERRRPGSGTPTFILLLKISAFVVYVLNEQLPLKLLLLIIYVTRTRQNRQIVRHTVMNYPIQTIGDDPKRLMAGLRELGWGEGQNIVIDYRFAEGRLDRLPDLAAELVRLKVDIIVSAGTQGVTAARNATKTIPIVMIGVRDPVGIGLSRASRGRAGTSQGCPAAPAWKSSPNSWSCSRRPFPKSTVWPSSRTRPMRTTSSR